jgi:acyl-CoA thioester hydrolase
MNREHSGTVTDGVHVFPVRVYYEDTDAGGIVYYANYLKFAERARTELLRIAGITHSDLMAETGVAFAVRHCAADFVKPARLDDPLTVHTRLTDIKGASIEMDQAIRRDGTDLVRLRVRLACMSRSGRPSRLPAPARTYFENFINREMASLDGK